jgi:hypothetical protein
VHATHDEEPVEGWYSPAGQGLHEVDVVVDW